MLHKAGKSKELLSSDLPRPASYVLLHDAGNLAIYNKDSGIIWQSIDYPTDTIVQGQTLKSSQLLRTDSYKYHITVRQEGELLLASACADFGECCQHGWCAHWKRQTRHKGSNVVLNLDTTGRLYLVASNLFVLRNITDGVEVQEENTVDKQRWIMMEPFGCMGREWVLKLEDLPYYRIWGGNPRTPRA